MNDENISLGPPEKYKELFDGIIETMNVKVVTHDILCEYMVSLGYPTRRTFKGKDLTTILFNSANLLKSYMELYNISVIKQKLVINLD